MAGCRFCELYIYLKASNQKFVRNHNRDPDSTFKLKTKYFAALEQKRVRYGGDGNYIKNGGTTITGNFPLRFCPTCGRRLK